MKKIILIIPAIAIILALYLTPAHAGITAGVSSWYTWWNVNPATGSSFKPGLLWGPTASVEINKQWSVAGVLLTGNVSENKSGFKYNYRRYDFDTTVNYNFSRFVKFFGGIKMINMGWNDDESTVPIFSFGESNYQAMGPGLGLGLTLPLTDSLFLVNNLSGLLVSGRQKVSGVKTVSTTSYGCNITSSFAYYIESITSTILIGGRYQLIHQKYSEMFETVNSSFWGVTFAMVYHFGMGD